VRPSARRSRPIAAIWAEAPLEAWSERAAERIAALARTLARPRPPPPRAGTPRPVARARHGLLRRQPQHRVPRRRSSRRWGAGGSRRRPRVPRALPPGAVGVEQQRQRPRAAPLFDEAEPACARAGNNDLHAKALYNGARCYASMGERDKAAARYARIETEHRRPQATPTTRACALLNWRPTPATDAQASRCWARIPTRYPQGRHAQRGAVAARLHRLARRPL